MSQNKSEHRTHVGSRWSSLGEWIQTEQFMSRRFHWRRLLCMYIYICVCTYYIYYNLYNTLLHRTIIYNRSKNDCPTHRTWQYVIPTSDNYSVRFLENNKYIYIFIIWWLIRWNDIHHRYYLRVMLASILPTNQINQNALL